MTVDITGTTSTNLWYDSVTGSYPSSLCGPITATIMKTSWPPFYEDLSMG
jgi:hypothetical protein